MESPTGKNQRDPIYIIKLKVATESGKRFGTSRDCAPEQTWLTPLNPHSKRFGGRMRAVIW